MKIVLLEDDLLLQELLVEHMSEAYEVVAFSDGEEALEYIYEEGADLLLLDINVPTLKGDKLLEFLRKNQNTTPAIFITSNNSSKDVKKGFEIGCDDYLKKPFEFEELDARIEHVKKIHNLTSKIKIADFTFYPDKHLLIKEGEEFHLTPKASKILHYLYTHRPRAVSKTELIENIWGYDSTPSDATLRSYIKTLRKLFPQITTIHGSGYAFV